MLQTKYHNGLKIAIKRIFVPSHGYLKKEKSRRKITGSATGRIFPKCLFVFPENKISENNSLHIVDVDGTAPSTMEIDDAVLIRDSQSTTCGES